MLGWTPGHCFAGMTITGARSIVSPFAIFRTANMPRPRLRVAPTATLRLFGSGGYAVVLIAFIRANFSIPPHYPIGYTPVIGWVFVFLWRRIHEISSRSE